MGIVLQQSELQRTKLIGNQREGIRVGREPLAAKLLSSPQSIEQH